jgi:succinoglycan biosynthesis transport protein ExoP
MDLWRIVGVLWARRVIMLTATVSCLLGGLLVIRTTPPRYEATSRVELEIAKPDPVTGVYVSSKNLTAYVNSQIQMIRDFQVAVRVAQNLGWLDNSDLQAAYAERPPGDELDFEHWVALRVSGGTTATLVDGTNVLEIKFRAVSPEIAQVVADNIRNAYIDTILAGRRDSARASSQRFAELAASKKVKLVDLEVNKSRFERQSGIILQGKNLDLDSARLRSLANAIPAGPVEVRGHTASVTALQLADAESTLAAVGKSLGPNHPVLNALRQRRDLLASQAAQERSAEAGLAGALARNQSHIAATDITSQMSKVIGQRPELTQLRLMQDEIDMERTRYSEAAQRSADLLQESDAGDSGVTPLGPTESSDRPTFPNKPLTLFGSMGLGLTIGALVSFLAELMGRRVRTERDLRTVVPGSTFILPKMRVADARKAPRPERKGDGALDLEMKAAAG